MLFSMKRLRIFWINLTKPAVATGFGHIYSRNPNYKTLLFFEA